VRIKTTVGHIYFDHVLKSRDMDCKKRQDSGCTTLQSVWTAMWCSHTSTATFISAGSLRPIRMWAKCGASWGYL